MRNALLAGVVCVFAPGLTAAKLLAPHSLLAIWAAKAGLNGWRCLTALFCIHCQQWPRWTGSAKPNGRCDPGRCDPGLPTLQSGMTVEPLNAGTRPLGMTGDTDDDYQPVD